MIRKILEGLTPKRKMPLFSTPHSLLIIQQKSLRLLSLCSFLSLLATTSQALAEAPKWQIINDKSEIRFTATQNNAPVSGEFKSFNGDIYFDTAQLSVSNVSIVIKMDSVKASYIDITNTLKSAEWFDVKTFPQATFKATSFSHLENNTYQAKGTLSIRDKSSIVTFPFQLEQITPKTAVATGELSILRSTFGVGRGEWASTDSIKDEVKIHFKITATKAVLKSKLPPAS